MYNMAYLRTVHYTELLNNFQGKDVNFEQFD